jgi:hypothetical protein
MKPEYPEKTTDLAHITEMLIKYPNGILAIVTQIDSKFRGYIKVHIVNFKSVGSNSVAESVHMVKNVIS